MEMKTSLIKIAAPLSAVREVIPLVEAGADEFYCGIVPNELRDRYSGFNFFNRRQGRRSSFNSFSDLKEAVKLAHDAGSRVFVTMNGLYSQHEYPFVLEVITHVNQIGVDALIVADIGLLLTLREQGISQEIHISTGGTTFNWRTATYYKELGASRIILDRHLTIEEITDLTQKLCGLEFEVFILRSLCRNIDGFCTFVHFASPDLGVLDQMQSNIHLEEDSADLMYIKGCHLGGDACALPYAACLHQPKRLSSLKIEPPTGPPIPACGVCALFDLSQINIASVKIVGREMPADGKVRATKFIHSVLDLLASNPHIGKGAFVKSAQDLAETYWGQVCTGHECYYPSAVVEK